MDRKLSFSILVLCIAGCAAKEQTFWEKGKKGTITVHHVRKTSKGTSDRTEQLSEKTMTPDMVHVYDLGRMPDGNGGMHEAHKYYQVVQSASFDLRLPPAGKMQPSGPKTVFTSPTYSPPPKDQRINDAVASAHQAKEKLDDATKQVEQTDNNLRGEVQDLNDQNASLKDQLNKAMSTPQHTVPASDAAKAGTSAVADPLALWGKQVQP
jgi:hypothetical protein